MSIIYGNTPEAETVTWKRADGEDVPGYAFGDGTCTSELQ